MKIKEIFDNYLPLIEAELDGLVSIKGEKYAEVKKAMRYSLLSGGKRIRPILLLEFHKLCGGNVKDALKFAAALEMIHTYSLIHDDLPCMDNDDMRRGKPSCHKAFSEDTALLAGDALLTLAFSVSAKTDLPPELSLRAVAFLADMAGPDGMVGGQVMDLAFEKSGADAEDLTSMYLKKTSCLLVAASVCGAILAGANETEIENAKEYAESLGLAFQIIDDILDCTADQNALGKPVGSDDKNGKTTFVTLFGIEGARNKATKLTEKALASLDKFKGDSTDLKEITKYLLDRTY